MAAEKKGKTWDERWAEMSQAERDKLAAAYDGESTGTLTETEDDESADADTYGYMAELGIKPEAVVDPGERKAYEAYLAKQK